MKVSRRGKDLAVRIPVSVTRALGLKAGDEIDMKTVGTQLLELALVERRDDNARSSSQNETDFDPLRK